MTIGADDLRNKYKGDTIAIAEAWIRGHLSGYWERIRIELRTQGVEGIPPPPSADILK